MTSLAVPDTTPRRVVVASVPAGHVYVRHLAPESGDGPVRLVDPPPLGVRRAPSGQWWPPAMLDPGWVDTHGHGLDVFHLHFGFDALASRDLERIVAALRRTATPLVYTVHDLRNPHHPDRAAHDALLDVLVPAADALVTLTPGAADEIARRWGRDALVVPHPHVVPFDTMREVREARDVRADRPFRVGLHLKSLRASMDPVAVLPTLVDTVADLPDAVLQVNAHRDVLDPAGARHDAGLARLLRGYLDAGRLELEVHDYLSDAALFSYLARLDVSVLPYRFGTHSGWLETCRDLGTTVVAPSCGYYADQGPVLGYRLDEDGYDPATLAAAVRRAHAERPDLGTTVADRRRQRQDVADAHDRLYRSLLSTTADTTTAGRA
ncbi:glycosyltransferase [Nocardioides rubriscoriae]|uniref:glycosyltransferase n=1 Tax=Nocardioides rubriscoriae TaxID=642762 RepID=UPI0011E05447|nr:glycosyltransferase [Nocardioides rubriscoriae]